MIKSIPGLAAFLFTIASTGAHAYLILGTGNGALLGNDLTDVGDDGVEANYNPPASLGGFDAVFSASFKEGFGGERAFDMFDNKVEESADKWCCGFGFQGHNPPWIVTADFGPNSFYLTHFTVASPFDVPGRDPRVWSIEGSNDGLGWSTIFHRNDPNSSVWTAREQVIRFDAGSDFSVQNQAYSMFRMVTTQTGLTTSARFQVAELELFGSVQPPGQVPAPAPIALMALGLTLLYRMRR